MGKRKTCESAEEVATANGGSTNTKPNVKVILAIMLQHRMNDKYNLNFEDIAKDLGVHERNKSWRVVWTAAKDDGYVEASKSGKGFEMTQKWIDFGATDEYKEYVKDMAFVPATKEEHQARIKKRFKCTKSTAIFETLEKYGSLTRHELAGLLGQKDRSHAFSYSLQEVKMKMGLAEVDPDAKGKQTKGSKLRLSDKAYLKPEDRPDLSLLMTKC